MSVGDKLSTLLQNCSSVTSYLTRTSSDCGDFPSLSQRAAMSNSWSADRFLSIHCNAGGGSGTETFWCDNSSSSNVACESFATEVQTQMVNYGDWNSRRVVEDDSYLNFHLGVLSPTNAIGCLSEIGFVDSADATKLLDDTWRNKFALAYYISLQNDLGITTCTGLDCSSAIPITCGVTYNGSSSSDTSLVDTYGCNTWTESGPERIHTITPTSNGTLTASLSNFTGDLDVYILGSCNPSDCLGTVSSSSATYINAIAGTTYYIVVDADDGSGSSYDLTVTCPIEDIYINNASSNINNLAPGYDIIITSNQNYTGTSTTIYDSYLYYYLSSDCSVDGSDLILNNQNFSSLNTNTNSDTIIQALTIPSTTTAGNYNIILFSDATNVIPEDNETNNTLCIPITITTPTLDCTNSIPLTCGVTYSGIDSTSNSYIESYGCNSWTESGPERIHTIIPNGNGTLTVTLSNYTGDLDVYILGSCDPTDCLGTVFSDSATFSNAIAGTTYYIVVDADDGSGSSYDLNISCPSANQVKLNPKVFLQGALLSNANTNIMRDDLRTLSYLPTTSPYTDTATCLSSVFNSGGTSGTGNINDDIVDWIWIELRDENDNTSIIKGKSALLQKDGDIVDLDGISELSFDIQHNNYFVAIKHRNHLAVISDSVFALTDQLTTVDFTNTSTPITFGTNAQAVVSGTPNVLALWAGDVNNDGKLNYIGAESEIPFISSQVFNDPNNSLFGGPPVATYNSLGYYNADIDMNGQTIYIGAGSDIPFLSGNIFNNPSNSLFGGPPIATYTFTQQLPEGAN
jgi:hypothetical protein